METKLLRWVTIVIALLIFYQSFTSVSADLIEDTCNKTSNFKFCVSFLRSKPGSATADVQGLAQIVADQIQIYLKDTFSKASKLYKEATERVIKECFQICSEEYGVAIQYMNGVLANLKSKSYRNAREGLSGVYVDADTCEESFHEEPVRPSPLTKNNYDVKDLAVIGSQIIHILGIF
ncbi:putative invertase inhibitor [Prunus yedoensis var. nudiflora]|uniref:Putative invertase inhibitor n=1 Tax=Prunus yedoensis var. nudiflora TaxID=2094558 RepID=A0A314Y9K3_PRUYE|nr:putative invertase inhibitor [Prunus yedoensis var. nudiflora]